MNSSKIPKTKKIFNKALFALICLVSFSSFATSIQQADSYFEKHQYQLALNEYLSSAESNNPNAFYQLGVIYYKGWAEKKTQEKFICQTFMGVFFRLKAASSAAKKRCCVRLKTIKKTTRN